MQLTKNCEIVRGAGYVGLRAVRAAPTRSISRPILRRIQKPFGHLFRDTPGINAPPAATKRGMARAEIPKRVCKGCMIISETPKRLCKGCMIISETPKWLRKGCMIISEIPKRLCKGCMIISETPKRLCRGCMIISETPKRLCKGCMVVSHTLPTSRKKGRAEVYALAPIHTEAAVC